MGVDSVEGDDLQKQKLNILAVRPEVESSLEENLNVAKIIVVEEG
jgi:hypothetical protein